MKEKNNIKALGMSTAPKLIQAYSVTSDYNVMVVAKREGSMWAIAATVDGREVLRAFSFAGRMYVNAMVRQVRNGLVSRREYHARMRANKLAKVDGTPSAEKEGGEE